MSEIELAARRDDRPPLVLILDDDENVGAFVRVTLKEPKYRTVWAGNLASAIAAVDAETPDLALVDISLDGRGSGLDLVKHLRSNRATEHTPVVMLTANEDTINRAKSLRVGADRYLIKPVKPETLRRVVNEVTGMRDDLWWTVNLREEQVSRMRELLFDTTTELPTLAVVVDDLRRLVNAGETLHV